jgi:hypothetical protein
VTLQNCSTKYLNQIAKAVSRIRLTAFAFNALPDSPPGLCSTQTPGLLACESWK